METPLPQSEAPSPAPEKPVSENTVLPPPEKTPEAAPAPKRTVIPPPPPPPKKKGGCFRCGCIAGIVIAALAALTLLAFFAAGIYHAAKNDGSGSSIREEKLPSVSSKAPWSSKNGKIAVIEVGGIILSGSGFSGEAAYSDVICDQLDKAADDSRVKGIIISLDTPGGEVTAADDIYTKIREVRRTTGKPVVALMNSVAASGGYYVAAGCDRIIAGKLTLTGSIGVIMNAYNYSGLLEKVGVQSEVYKSGPMKDMLNPARRRTEPERKLVQELIDETYGEFVKLVSESRRIPVEKIKGTPIGDGRVYSGRKALEYGMIDSIGKMPEAIAMVEKLSKSPKDSLNPVRYKRNFSILDLLLESRAEAGQLKVSVPGARALELPAGRLYFLPPEFL